MHRRRPPARAVACGRRLLRAVPAGAGAVVVLLLAMTAVLHQVGAWPFEREDEPPPWRSVPDARLPRPPSAVAPGGSGSGMRGMSGMSEPGEKPPGRDGGGEERDDCGCRASWQVDGRRRDFTASVRVDNTGEAPVRGWRITWTWPDGQRLVKGWNGRFRQSGRTVRVRNGGGNARIPAGGGTRFGLQATGRATPAPRLTCHAVT